ncbi:Flagellin N-methylase [Anatilimnocola aggregata]|uniref:Flagellin N-methylase n=1 Tax=Anatilimnocola aggregata TaxID=2528021 RepID=A0A517Y5Z3_9BACT|nr:YkgJ family cysteine cluster protein [Anatilimnocola aggregata]QDU25659.1 Flagellin N-methylase [Anatilimnocola aggregata]
MSEQPWYHAGLQFECTQCGDCCTGAPGYVWVNSAEIADLAALVLPEDPEKFEELYVRRVGVRKSLKEFPNGDCVFFDTDKRKCSVYGARPRQCKTWPFWDSNLRNEAAWQQTCEVCPGSGKGKLHQLGQIEEQRKQVKV